MLGLFEGAVDIARLQEDRLVLGEAYYVVLKVAVLITYVLFYRGFVALGGLFSNYLLRIASFVLIIGNVVVIGYDIASALYLPMQDAFVLGAEAFAYGGILIVYGVALRRVSARRGRRLPDSPVCSQSLRAVCSSRWCCSFIGFFVLMPAELLQIIILYKNSSALPACRACYRERAGPWKQAVV